MRILTNLARMRDRIGPFLRLLRERKVLSFKGALKHLIRLTFLFRQGGYKAVRDHLSRQIRPPAQHANPYGLWIKSHALHPAELEEMRRKSAALAYQPKFCVLMSIFPSEERGLRKSIDSVLAQVYPCWELFFTNVATTKADVQRVLQEYEAKDRRIQTLCLKENDSLSTAGNSALSLATGDFLCLLDPEDEISPDALFEFAQLLNLQRDADMIYSDEDRADTNGKRFEPFFKPAWSPEYFECYRYTGHFACYRTDVAKKMGGFRLGYEGAEEYDFVLRFVEQTGKILHIPKVLYHRMGRTLISSSSVNPQNNRTASVTQVLNDCLRRLRITGSVAPGPCPGCFIVRQDIRGNPLVSIVIPSAGKSAQILGKNVDLLSNCINSIHEKSTYPHYEIIVVDNDDLQESTIKAIKRQDCTFVHFKGRFNLARKINLGAHYAKGQYLLFLNDDTEVISADWLTAMLQLAQRREIGAVGAKLYFEDGTIEHVGVTFFDGLPDHIYRGFPGSFPGYFFSSAVNRNYLAVTGACLMTPKRVFEKVRGFNEDFAVNYNDIDYCLKVHEAGYRVVYASQAELFHYESKCRERTVDPKEVYLFLRFWHFKAKQDPYYNMHLETKPSNFEIRVCSTASRPSVHK